MILFTSGSEGTPKGVVLTHRNILSNCAQVGARIDFGPGDTLFNVLPVFHSFGLTGGMVLPLISGVRLYLYPSPLHYRIIPELVYGTNATIMFGTDTFLAGYAKSANPYDFRSLRYVLGRRRAGEAGDAPDLQREVRPAHPRGLWRDGDVAGAGRQHADVQPQRHRRPHPAGHGGPARGGAGHR